MYPVRNYNYEPDDINCPVQQSKYIGDCWLISAIYALSQSKKGLKILRESVERNLTFTNVYFKAIDTTVNLNNEDIIQTIMNGKYSQGNKSFIIFELAFEKLRNEIHKGKIILPKNMPNFIKKIPLNIFKNKLNVGRAAEVFYFLTGNKVQYLFSDNYEGIKTFENTKDIVACCNFNTHGKSFINILDKSFMIEDYNKNKFMIYLNHSYCIKIINKNWVSIVNPHNTASEIFLNKNVFYSNLGEIEYCVL